MSIWPYIVAGVFFVLGCIGFVRAFVGFQELWRDQR